MNAIGNIRLSLESDEKEISIFVDCLFRYADPGTLVGLRSFTHDKEDQKPRIYGWPSVHGDLSGVITAAAKAATGAANSVVRLVFCPPVATFKGALHGTKQQATTNDLANGLVVSVELDKGNIPELRAELERLLGPATVVIKSGGQWIDPETGEIFDKIHLHWRLAVPTRTTDEHLTLKWVRDMATALVGADTTAVPVVHPLRWPGSWHTKTSTPKLAIIECFSKDAEITLDYASGILIEALKAAGLDVPERGVKRKKQAKTSATYTSNQAETDMDRLTSAVMAIPNANASWHEWNETGGNLHSVTNGFSDGLSLWIDWSRKSGKHDENECNARWNHFHAHPFTQLSDGSLFYRARSHGWRDERSKAKATRSEHSYDYEPDSGRDVRAEVEGQAGSDERGPGVEAAHDREPVDDDVAGDPEREPETATSNSVADADNVTDLDLERALRCLSVVEFEAQRETLAKAFNIRPRALDALRRKHEAAAKKVKKQAEANARKDEDQKAKEAKRAGANGNHSEINQMIS